MGRTSKNHGVEQHGKSFRYRMRVSEQGNKRVASYKRWPFVEGLEAKKLSKDDPLRKENAKANALAFALRDRQARKSPQWDSGAKDAEGTLLEWLIRFQVEALELRAYRSNDLGAHLDRINLRLSGVRTRNMPPDPVATVPTRFQIQPRAEKSVDHDLSQIRSLVRLGKGSVELNDVLYKHIKSLGSGDIHAFLAAWGQGKAKPKTKRKLLSLFSAVYSHHAEFHSMKASKPWQDIKVLGDGKESKARALLHREVEKIEAELKRLHPTVRGAIEFLRWTGARRGEAEKLVWENIIWNTGKNSAPSAHFKRTKAARGTYKARFVYLEDGCVCALARMVRPKDEAGNPIDYIPGEFDFTGFQWPKKGWVFPAPNTPTQPISGDTIYQAFVRSVAHAGLPHASPHHLRHTKATVLTATVPQAMAQEMLGHDDASTFAIYRHLAEEAGYMVRDKQGHLVNADELKSKDAIIDAIMKLPKEERGDLVAQLFSRGG